MLTNSQTSKSKESRKKNNCRKQDIRIYHKAHSFSAWFCDFKQQQENNNTSTAIAVLTVTISKSEIRNLK